MDIAALRNYAAALYDQAEAEEQLPAVLSGLEMLAEVVSRTPEVLRLAQHPGVSVDEKVALLLALLGAGTPSVLGRFLALTLERHRFVDLPQLVALFKDVKDEREGLQPVLVESAAELSPAQTKRLEVALGRLLHRPVRVESRVVADLLGGLRLHVNSEILDESLTGWLDRLEEYLSRPLAEPHPLPPLLAGEGDANQPGR